MSVPGDEWAQEPETGAGGADGVGAIVTRAAVEHLARTRPWVAFISVLGFVACGLLVLIGLLVMLLGGLTDEIGLVGGIVLGLIYLLGAGIYLFVSLQLSRYAGAIRAFARSPGSLALEQALGHQRAFWRLVGIIAIVVTCIYVLGIACALLIGVITALAGLTGA